MNSLDHDPERADGFVPETTTGLRLLVGRSESGDQNDVRIALGEGVEQKALVLLPSHAKELARHLMQSATALDAEFPSQLNR